MEIRFRSRTWPLLPLVLLTVILLEEVAIFHLRKQVADPYIRTAGIMALYGVGFAVAAGWISPWLKRLLGKARTGSRRGAGHFGIWVFYALAYGMLFVAYFVLETKGMMGLLPESMR